MLLISCSITAQQQKWSNGHVLDTENEQSVFEYFKQDGINRGYTLEKYSSKEQKNLADVACQERGARAAIGIVSEAGVNMCWPSQTQTAALSNNTAMQTLVCEVWQEELDHMDVEKGVLYCRVPTITGKAKNQV